MLSLELSAADVWLLLVSLFGLCALIGLAERLQRLGVGPGRTRSMVHTGVCVFVSGTPFLFSGPGPVYVLAGVFVMANATARSWGWWEGIHAARSESWGTVTLPLAVFPALAATWSVADGRIVILQTAFLLLGIADPTASTMGNRLGRRTLVADATRIGSLVFFGSSAAVTGAVLLVAGVWGPTRVVSSAVAVALVATAVEAVSRRGWDNFCIVLAVVLVMTPLLEGTVTLRVLGFGLLVGIVFGGLAWWARVLDASGAVGGGLFAASLVAFGGWEWAAPGFVFFVLASALSTFPGAVDVRGGTTESDEDGRTMRQVLANGGIAWTLLSVFTVLPPGPPAYRGFLYVGFLGALAAAAADTWATEIGSRMSTRPRSLRTLQPVAAGTSGAISLIGTLAAIAGASSVAGAAVIATGTTTLRIWPEAGVIVIAGGVGMLADSLAGAHLEGADRVLAGDAGAGRGEPTESVVHGWAWVNNEVVNVIATSTGTLAAVLLYLAVS